MPTYDYICKTCGHGFEVFIPSADKEKVNCPQCQSSELREVYTVNTVKSSSGESDCDSCASNRFGFS